MNLINSIDEYLLSGEGKKRDAHYASDVSACRRQLYYKWTGESPSNPITAGALWKMRMGDAIHGLIQDFLEAKGFDIISEVSLRKKYDELVYPVSMRVDALFDPGTGVEGIEVKSSYGAGILAIQRAGEPKPEHLAQIALYADGYNVQKWSLIYIGRDNGYRTQFDLEYNGGMLMVKGGRNLIAVTDLIQRLGDIEKAMDGEEVPERDFKVAIKNGKIVDGFQKEGVKYKGNWQCAYCQFRDMCWQEELEKYIGRDNSEELATKENDEE